ncbi:MAG: FkbM family methyltransferase [Gammaproteobacteria bacterium]|nr:FkbM family methyltransferase [Gammaproteobacteria bacterium]
MGIGAALRSVGLFRDRRIGRYTVLREPELYAYWEEVHLRRLFALLGVDCVFDVGANRGQYAQLLRQRVGYTGLLVSFEPIPALARVLRDQAAADPDWVIDESALAADNGAHEFNIMATSEFSSLSTPCHEESGRFRALNRIVDTIAVDTETLGAVQERYASEYAFTRPFLKLDTQGKDLEILAADPVATKRFVGVQIELSVKRLYADAVPMGEALRGLKELGFEVCAFMPTNPGHFPELIETDCLLLREDLMAQLH